MEKLFGIYGSREKKTENLYGFVEYVEKWSNISKIDLLNYFNAFFPKDWYEFSSIDSVSIVGLFEGMGTIQLYGYKGSDSSSSKFLLEMQFQSGEQFELKFPEDWKDYSVIYPKIVANANVKLCSLYYCTNNLSIFSENHIGIVICTFNKPEFLKRTLSKLSSVAIRDLKLSICVVDNASNLPLDIENSFPNLTVLPNRNYGGSGGFTRGMLHFSAKEEITHILLMDDDVDIDERIFERVNSILKYRKDNKQVYSGTMLDSFKPDFVYESSATINYKSIRMEPYNYLLETSNRNNLLKLSEKETLSFAAWWFMIFPKSAIMEAGFSFPFFIRADDVEFSFRLRKLGYTIHRFNGLALWHEPFYAKDPVWIHYYTIRNLLVLFALYPKGKSLSRFFQLWKLFWYHLVMYHYLQCEFVKMALADYLKGPDYLVSLEFDKFHANLTHYSNAKNCLKVSMNPLEFKSEKKLSLWKRIIFAGISIFTGNLFIFPAFKEKTQIQKESISAKLTKVLGSKVIEELDSEKLEKKIYEKQTKRGLVLVGEFFKLSFQYLFLSKMIDVKWRKMHEDLVSKEFWEKFLGLNSEGNEKSNQIIS